MGTVGLDVLVLERGLGERVEQVLPAGVGCFLVDHYAVCFGLFDVQMHVLLAFILVVIGITSAIESDGLVP